MAYCPCVKVRVCGPGTVLLEGGFLVTGLHQFYCIKNLCELQTSFGLCISPFLASKALDGLLQVNLGLRDSVRLCNPAVRPHFIAATSIPCYVSWFHRKLTSAELSGLRVPGGSSSTCWQEAPSVLDRASKSQVWPHALSILCCRRMSCFLARSVHMSAPLRRRGA